MIVKLRIWLIALGTIVALMIIGFYALLSTLELWAWWD